MTTKAGVVRRVHVVVLLAGFVVLAPPTLAGAIQIPPIEPPAAPPVGVVDSSAVTGVGDLSGDGVPDTVALTPATESGRGSVVAVSGVDGAQLWSWEELSALLEQPPSFGEVVVVTPDVSGDGIADLLVSARSVADRPQRAASGGKGLLATLAGVLDLVAAPVSVGRVHILSGATGEVVRSISDPTPGGNDGFGTDVTVIGDEDGDGVVDHLIAERGADQLHLFSGREGLLIRSVAAPAAGATEPDSGETPVVHAAVTEPAGGETPVVHAAVTEPAGSETPVVQAAVTEPAGVATPVVQAAATEPAGGEAALAEVDPVALANSNAETIQPVGCTGAACAEVAVFRAQALTQTTTAPRTTTTTPPTATLPRPASATTGQSGHPNTGGEDASTVGVLALAVGMGGIAVTRRPRHPSLRGAPPSRG